MNYRYTWAKYGKSVHVMIGFSCDISQNDSYLQLLCFLGEIYGNAGKKKWYQEDQVRVTQLSLILLRNYS